VPEVLGSPPSPRTALFWNGTAWQWALVDAAGRLQIDVVDAAGLQDALQSVATDRLIVRGEDQLFSFRERLGSTRTAAISGAGGFIASNPVPAGRVWKVTNIHASDLTSPTTSHAFAIQRGAATYYFNQNTAAFAIGEGSFYNGEVWLEPTDVVRVWFTGGLGADNCIVTLTGYEMTKEA